MDRIRARGVTDLRIREAASRTFKVPEGSKDGFFDQHDFKTSTTMQPRQSESRPPLFERSTWA
jgi:hypothetical protein